MTIPLRADLAGGWLDVPRHAIQGAFVVNCAISPLVEIEKDDGHAMCWEGTNYSVVRGSGLGTSAAWYILHGHDVAKLEADAGCGWQDEAVIRRTGLCVWASGPEPVLVHHSDGEWLAGRLALYWTGKSHCSSSIADLSRDYATIASASILACKAVQYQSLEMLGDAVEMSYEQQLSEGMDELPVFGMAGKYCGAGHGGYAVYLFEDRAHRDSAVDKRGLMAVEPYCASAEEARP